jgi:hypothetical protein
VSQLLSWAEHEFNLNQTDDQGISVKEHLKQVERSAGYTPEGLENPTQFPRLLMYLWLAYCRLNKRRESGFNGPESLSPTLVKDWISLTGEPLSHWDIEVIFKLDDKYIEAYYKNR